MEIASKDLWESCGHLRLRQDVEGFQLTLEKRPGIERDILDDIEMADMKGETEGWESLWSTVQKFLPADRFEHIHIHAYLNSSDSLFRVFKNDEFTSEKVRECAAYMLSVQKAPK